jgi:hypothetical protein
MDEQLRELQVLAAQARSKKGRMDAASRLRAAELLASLWRESPELARETPLLFDDLSSEAVADAVLKMWPSLPDERRSDFKRSLYKPTTERSTRRLALLVAAVINSDGDTALEWLQVLLPREKRNVAKDVQQALSSLLFGSPPLAFETLARAHADDREVSRIYSALWDIAKFAPPGSSLMARAKLAKAFVRFALAQDQENIHAHKFLIELQDETNQWPAHLQELFDNEIPELRERMMRSVTISVNERTKGEATSESAAPPVSLDAQPLGVAIAQSQRATEKQVNTEIHTPASQVVPGPSTPQIDCLELLSRLTNNAKSDLSVLGMMHDLVKTLIDEKNSLSNELEMARQRLQAAEIKNQATVLKFEQQSADSNARVAELKAEVERSYERARSVTAQLTKERDESIDEVSRLRAEIAQTKSAWEGERGLLAQQIGANAAGRVDEFRKRLGGSLSRLAHDLPQKDEAMSSDLGSAVLLLFHQFVEALQEQGIPLTTGRNTQ